MSIIDNNISLDDIDYIMNKLPKRIDDIVEFKLDSSQKYIASYNVIISDNFNLVFRGSKRTISKTYYGFSLLYNNTRISGIDWKIRQNFEDGIERMDSYHCNEWNEKTQGSDRHLFNKDLDYKLKNIDDDDSIIRFVLKRWNIDYKVLEQLKMKFPNNE